MTTLLFIYLYMLSAYEYNPPLIENSLTGDVRSLVGSERKVSEGGNFCRQFREAAHRHQRFA